MSDLGSFLETTWDGILSRDEQFIKDTFTSLSEADREVVKAHLVKMTTEEGWHAEQVVSARIALQVITQMRRKRHGH